MYKTKAYSAASATSPLAPTTIPRRDPTDRDVQIEILFCGICHSDLHYGPQRVERRHAHGLPVRARPRDRRPRHARSARRSRKFKAGDLAAVGCLVDSDRTCPNCRAGLEQFCPNLMLTYSSPDKHGTAPVTYGGYSDSIVVDEHFVLRVPPNLDLAGAAPLLCAGITTYSPLRHWGVTKGKKVGVVGLGGLGHMGVKFAHAFGAHVGRLHDLAEQEGRRAAARRRRGRRLPQRRRDEEARRQLRLHPRRASPPSTTSTPTSTCSRATAT